MSGAIAQSKAHPPKYETYPKPDGTHNCATWVEKMLCESSIDDYDRAFFGQQAYFVNIPSKFISADGRTLWLCYSANFAAGWGKADIQSRPEGSKYALCLQEVKLLGG